MQSSSGYLPMGPTAASHAGLPHSSSGALQARQLPWLCSGDPDLDALLMSLNNGSEDEHVFVGYEDDEHLSRQNVVDAAPRDMLDMLRCSEEVPLDLASSAMPRAKMRKGGPQMAKPATSVTSSLRSLGSRMQNALPKAIPQTLRFFRQPAIEGQAMLRTTRRQGSPPERLSEKQSLGERPSLGQLSNFMSSASIPGVERGRRSNFRRQGSPPKSLSSESIPGDERGRSSGLTEEVKSRKKKAKKQNMSLVCRSVSTSIPQGEKLATEEELSPEDDHQHEHMRLRRQKRSSPPQRSTGSEQVEELRALECARAASDSEDSLGQTSVASSSSSAEMRAVPSRTPFTAAAQPPAAPAPKFLADAQAPSPKGKGKGTALPVPGKGKSAPAAEMDSVQTLRDSGTKSLKMMSAAAAPPPPRAPLQDIAHAACDIPASLSQDSSEEVLQQLRQEIHAAVCDACDSEIVGTRMKCKTCSDFDLCQQCYRDGRNAHGHKFEQIRLLPLLCSRGHRIEPGAWSFGSAQCSLCESPLRNGITPEGTGPQFRCVARCQYAVCAPCYWNGRNDLKTEFQVEAAEGMRERALYAGRSEEGKVGRIKRGLKADKHLDFDDDQNEKQKGREALEVENEICAADAVLAQALHEEEDAVAAEDSNKQDAPEARSSLQCHLLFSSPLCISRAWGVQFECDRLVSPKPAMSELQAEVTAWGLEFDSNRPWVVSAVRPGGKVASWNSHQQYAESMIRPGDEIWQIRKGSITQQVQGQALALPLFALLSRASTEPTTSPVVIQIMFRGLRSMKQLRIEEEIAALQVTGCEVLPRAATAENIRELIAAANCRVLHLALHCASEEDQFLILEDKYGKAHVLPSSDLRKLFVSGQRRQQIGLVVLNACHSLTLGTHFVNAGVKHVVCVRDEKEVRDSSCRLLARHFFHALKAGRSVQEAFDCGVAVLQCGTEAYMHCDASAFMLIPQDGDHSEVFASSCGPSLLPKPSIENKVDWGALPPPIEDFLGREVDIHRLLYLIDQRRFIEIHGESGIGKSTLMAEVGRFVELRRELFQVTRWIDSKDLECLNGLSGLKTQILSKSRERVLLLIDSMDVINWPCVRELLRLPGTHVAIHSRPDVGAPQAADVGAGPVALAAGLKLTPFQVGPLEPLSQAQLFLRRASRPLYTFEVKGARRSPLDCKLVQPKIPAEFLALAEAPIIMEQRGSPARIAAAARQLSASSPEFPSMEQSIGGDASAGPSPRESVSTSQWSPKGQRKVRLVRPDGKSKDEWLPHKLSIDDVANCFGPRALRGCCDVFIDGCHAQPEAVLTDFNDDIKLGILLLEFRAKEDDDW